jgi:hypothetical protein
MSKAIKERSARNSESEVNSNRSVSLGRQGRLGLRQFRHLCSPHLSRCPKFFFPDRLDTLQLPADDLFLPRAGFIQILSPGQARNTTVQVWTVVEGFGIGSEFRQTRCAANNFRDHEVLFRWFQVLQSVAHVLDLRCLLFQSRS